jgi:hypothetical protein
MPSIAETIKRGLFGEEWDRAAAEKEKRDASLAARALDQSRFDESNRRFGITEERAKRGDVRLDAQEARAAQQEVDRLARGPQETFADIAARQERQREEDVAYRGNVLAGQQASQAATAEHQGAMRKFAEQRQANEVEMANVTARSKTLASVIRLYGERIKGAESDEMAAEVMQEAMSFLMSQGDPEAMQLLQSNEQNEPGWFHRMLSNVVQDFGD